MAGEMMAKVFWPLGLTLLLVGVAEAILAFLVVLLDLTGDFPTRVIRLVGTTGLVFVVGGWALTQLGKPRT